MKLTINIEKKYAYIIMSLILISIGMLAVNAYVSDGSGNPIIMGHSGSELDLSEGVNGPAVFNDVVTMNDNVSFEGDVNIVGNLGLNVQVIECWKGDPCDTALGTRQVRYTCPTGYILTGCAPRCNPDFGESITECSIYGTQVDTCTMACSDSGADPVCDMTVRHFGVHATCMRITDIGDS